MATVVRFTTKKRKGIDWNDPELRELECYYPPVLKESHVITPRAERSTKSLLYFDGTSSDDIAKHRTVSALKRIGLDGYKIPADTDNPNVSITPLGNGYMATITLTLDI